MIFKISWAVDLSRKRDCVVSIGESNGDGPQLLNKLSKVWRVHVWQNYKGKN